MKINTYWLLIVAVLLVSLSVPAYADIPVRVTNTVHTAVVSEPSTPRNVNVLSEPNTTRKVSVVSEPVTPRDVNVLNTVNVTATQPLPVTQQTAPINPADYFSVVVSPPGGSQVVNITTVPAGKILLVTDVVVVIGDNTTDVTFGHTTIPGTITDVKLVVKNTSRTTVPIHLSTPLIFTEGQQLVANSSLGATITVVGKLQDV